jgi:osmotically-inducible protein OsmY
MSALFQVRRDERDQRDNGDDRQDLLVDVVAVLADLVAEVGRRGASRIIRARDRVSTNVVSVSPWSTGSSLSRARSPRTARSGAPERAVERVAGVRGIANELEVKLSTERSDADIAHAAVDAMKWNVMVPSDKITVKVSKGWVTLEGEARWDYQRRAAERAVRDLPGVRGVSNFVRVKPRVDPEHVKEKIEETFKRTAALDANRITVQAEAAEVTLRGTVRSWVERHEAEKAAWAAPGVTAVHNYITVSAAA